MLFFSKHGLCFSGIKYIMDILEGEIDWEVLISKVDQVVGHPGGSYDLISIEAHVALEKMQI